MLGDGLSQNVFVEISVSRSRLHATPLPSRAWPSDGPASAPSAPSSASLPGVEETYPLNRGQQELVRRLKRKYPDFFEDDAPELVKRFVRGYCPSLHDDKDWEAETDYQRRTEHKAALDKETTELVGTYDKLKKWRAVNKIGTLLDDPSLLSTSTDFTPGGNGAALAMVALEE